MERSKKAEEIISQANVWTFAGDCSLLSWMQEISQNLEERAQTTNKMLQEINLNINRTNTALDNAANSLTALQYTQFVESRCHDDDETLANLTEVPVEESNVAAKSQNEILQTFLKNNLKMLYKCHEKYALDFDDSDEEDAANNCIYQPKNPYNDNLLPHIYGSKLWKENWHVGLCDGSNEFSGDEASETFSETASSSEDESFESNPEWASSTSVLNETDCATKIAVKNTSSLRNSQTIFPQERTTRKVHTSAHISQHSTAGSESSSTTAPKSIQKPHPYEQDLFTSLQDNTPPTSTSLSSSSAASSSQHIPQVGGYLTNSKISTTEKRVIPLLDNTIPPLAPPAHDIFAEPPPLPEDEEKFASPSSGLIKRKPVNLFDDDDFNSFMTAIVDKAQEKENAKVPTPAVRNLTLKTENKQQMPKPPQSQYHKHKKVVNLFDSPEEDELEDEQKLPPKEQIKSAIMEQPVESNNPTKPNLNLFDSPETSPIDDNSLIPPLTKQKDTLNEVTEEKRTKITAKTLFDDDDDDDDFLNIFGAKSLKSSSTTKEKTNLLKSTLFEDEIGEDEVTEQKQGQEPQKISRKELRNHNLFDENEKTNADSVKKKTESNETLLKQPALFADVNKLPTKESENQKINSSQKKTDLFAENNEEIFFDEKTREYARKNKNATSEERQNPRLFADMPAKSKSYLASNLFDDSSDIEEGDLFRKHDDQTTEKVVDAVVNAKDEDTNIHFDINVKTTNQGSRKDMVENENKSNQLKHSPENKSVSIISTDDEKLMINTSSETLEEDSVSEFKSQEFFIKSTIPATVEKPSIPDLIEPPSTQEPFEEPSNPDTVEPSSNKAAFEDLSVRNFSAEPSTKNFSTQATKQNPITDSSPKQDVFEKSSNQSPLTEPSIVQVTPSDTNASHIAAVPPLTSHNYTSLFSDEPPDDDDDDLFNNTRNKPSGSKLSLDLEQDFYDASLPELPIASQSNQFSDINVQSNTSDYGGLRLFSEVPPDDDDDDDGVNESSQDNDDKPFFNDNQTLRNVFYDDFNDSFASVSRNNEGNKIPTHSLFDDEPPTDNEDVDFMARLNKSQTKAKVESTDSIANTEEVSSNMPHRKDVSIDLTDESPRKLPATCDIEKPISDVVEEKKSGGKEISKLKMPKININVQALLPGAGGIGIADLKKKQNSEESSNQTVVRDGKTPKTATTKAENKQSETMENILPNICKNRVRVPVKRRPSTRRGRQESYQKSLLIEEEEKVVRNFNENDTEEEIMAQIETESAKDISHSKASTNFSNELVKEVKKMQTNQIKKIILKDPEIPIQDVSQSVQDDLVVHEKQRNRNSDAKDIEKDILVQKPDFLSETDLFTRSKETSNSNIKESENNRPINKPDIPSETDLFASIREMKISKETSKVVPSQDSDTIEKPKIHSTPVLFPDNDDDDFLFNPLQAPKKPTIPHAIEESNKSDLPPTTSTHSALSNDGKKSSSTKLFGDSVENDDINLFGHTSTVKKFDESSGKQNVSPGPNSSNQGSKEQETVTVAKKSITKSLFFDDQSDSDDDLFKSSKAKGPLMKATSKISNPSSSSSAQMSVNKKTDSLFGEDDNDDAHNNDEDDFLSAIKKPQKSKIDSKTKKNKGGSLFSDVESDDDDDLFGATKTKATTTKKAPTKTVPSGEKQPLADPLTSLQPTNQPLKPLVTTPSTLEDNPLADLLNS